MKLTQQSIHKFFFIDKNYKHLLKYSFQRNTKNVLKNLYNIIQQSFKKYNQLFSHLPQNKQNTLKTILFIHPILMILIFHWKLLLTLKTIL